MHTPEDVVSWRDPHTQHMRAYARVKTEDGYQGVFVFSEGVEECDFGHYLRSHLAVHINQVLQGIQNFTVIGLTLKDETKIDSVYNTLFVHGQVLDQKEIIDQLTDSLETKPQFDDFLSNLRKRVTCEDFLSFVVKYK